MQERLWVKQRGPHRAALFLVQQSLNQTEIPMLDLNTPIGKAIAESITRVLTDVGLPDAAVRINATLIIDQQGRREVIVNVFPNTQVFYANATTPPQITGYGTPMRALLGSKQ
jgi:hypothetical protein